MKKIGIAIVLFLLIFLLTWVVRTFLWGRELDFSGEKRVTIVENGFRHLKATTLATTFEELVKEKNLELSVEDEVFLNPTTKIFPGMIIRVNRAVSIEIEVDNKTIQKKVLARTVGDALAETNVQLSHLDKVEPEKIIPLENDQKIVVTRINVEEVTKEEIIEFKTVKKDDRKLRWRKKKVEQEGEEGAKEVVYEITYKNGKQVKKEKLSSKIIKQPVDEIVKIGTKVEVGKTQKGRASWYAYTGTMACASVKFPKGTWLRVTSRGNGKQIFVQVNDYGPDPGTGKVIDLDAVAFKKLAPLGAGVIDVKVEEILE